MARLAGSLAAMALLWFCAAAPASAQVSFVKAWGWGVADGASRFETCTTTCHGGRYGGGAGQVWSPEGVAADSAGYVFVADSYNARIDEFSPAGAFIKAWGWGVADGARRFETCTTTCQSGVAGGGAGELFDPDGVAIDGSGDVFVGDTGNLRIDEFSSTGAFIKAWGWGVLDGEDQLETCTTTCQYGGNSGGLLDGPRGIAVDGSGDVFVTDYNRVDEFSSAGAFIKAWGWGVADGASRLETCTTTCQAGLAGSRAGQLDNFAYPEPIAVDHSGHVFVADHGTDRVDEFSSAGAFIKAWGWGVADGHRRAETCATTCQAGLTGFGAGQLDEPEGVAVDGSGDVFVADTVNTRVDEFSSTGAFIKAWGWGVGVSDRFETCTTTCGPGTPGSAAGQFDLLWGIAADGLGDVFVTERGLYTEAVDSERVDEFHTTSAPQSAPVPKASKSTWSRIARRAAFPVFRPLATLGLRFNGVALTRYYGCLTASWGNLHSRRGPRLAIDEPGDSVRCGQPGEATRVATAVVNGVKVPVLVQCAAFPKCTIKDGETNGEFLLFVPERAAKHYTIQLDSAHVSLSNFLKVARSFIRVR